MEITRKDTMTLSTIAPTLMRAANGKYYVQVGRKIYLARNYLINVLKCPPDSVTDWF
jgi:hypothetical protein